MRVFWDSNLFIYLFEENGALSRSVEGLLSRLQQRGDELLTSSFALAEVCTGPARAGDWHVVAEWERLIRSNVTVLSFDDAAIAPFIRGRLAGIKAPDAIQVACAAAAGVDLFVTNDERLSRRGLPGVPMFSSLAQVPI